MERDPALPMSALLEQARTLADKDAWAARFPAFVAMDVEGRLKVMAIVTDGADREAALGRRIVRETAEVTAYVIVTRTQLIIDDQGGAETFLVYEAAGRGEAMARRLAVRVAPQTGGFELDRVQSALVPLDPWALGWNGAMPERVSHERRQAAHIVNHALAGENVDRTIRFLAARVRFHALNLPEGSTQVVFVDDRGQNVAQATRARIRESVGSAAEVRFLGER